MPTELMPLFKVDVRRDVRIPAKEPGVTLSADLFLPVGTDAVPALVTVLPYRKDAVGGALGEADLRWFAGCGYACLLVDFLGTGSSDGMQRPPFDAAEADDAIAAIDWAARQPWCTGSIGMWGASYGALMSMRAAARHPPQLKAIVAVEGPLDPERDFVHPGGQRGCLRMASWGMLTLVNQLLPPLAGYGTQAEHRRWERRFHMEPWLCDLFGHGPDDASWRSKVVDPSAIAVPAFCIAGWRDLFCDATIRAYECIKAPKKLLVGPWPHTMPHYSPFEPVEIRALALRWWDCWLRGIDNSITDEPPVTAFVQGERPEWRQFGSWPPAQASLRLSTDGRATLVTRADNTSPDDEESAVCHAVAECFPNPTVGVASGAWDLLVADGGTTDQHDDDMRSLTTASDVLHDDILVAGRPLVTIQTAGGLTAGRLIVRLTDVDTAGRSTLITAGVAAPTGRGETQTAQLAPTCYQVPAGHHIRVAVSSADFPRLWPDTQDRGDAGHLSVSEIRMALPVIPDGDGQRTVMPRPTGMGALADQSVLHRHVRAAVNRDLISDSAELVLSEQFAVRAPGSDHVLELRNETRASVTPAAPGAARLWGTSSAIAHMASGEQITVEVELHLTSGMMTAAGQVDVDGKTVFSRRWQAVCQQP